jgi:hypothetical protein
MPFGLIHFKLYVNQPGDEAEVTIYFSQNPPVASKWYKYDPIEVIWQDYSAYTEFGPNQNYLSLTLIDGGIGDADGIANGIIVDPSGIGTQASGSDNDNDDDLKDKLNDMLDNINVSCFIVTAAHQSENQEQPDLWSEIRGRELSILFITLVLFYAVKLAAVRIKRNRGFLRCR